MRSLAGKSVVLGVSGGIAAYKSAEIIRLLRRAGCGVQVVMTEAARRFIGELTLQTLSERPVLTDLFDLDGESRISHIRLAEEADLLLVAPATADVIARMAAGLGNDLLTTLALVTRAPMLLAPAMNVHMWEHPLTQANLTRLRLTGRLHTVGPGHGILACGDVGPGRMADPALIVEAGARLLERQDLRGRRVLVTAGPTQEPLDPVRYLGNRSSGKMGFAVARSAHLRGAQVTLVTGPTSAAPPPDLDVIRVGTAAEMEAAVSARYDSVDVIVMTAAVADFRPAEPADGKLKKDALGADPVVRLARNPDILAGLGRRRQAAGGGPLLVGFAAETGDAVAEARRKLAEKGCDLIVANDVCEPGAGFGQDTNKVSFVGPASVPPRSGASPAPIVVEDLPLLTKEEVAHRLWDRILQLGGGA